MGVGILLILFDLRKMWDPSFIPGPTSYNMSSIFPEALRDAAISAFGLTFYGTMFSPIGGALSGFAVYRWRTRNIRTEDARPSSKPPQDVISSVLHVLIGSVLGIGVVWLVLQACPILVSKLQRPVYNDFQNGWLAGGHGPGNCGSYLLRCDYSFPVDTHASAYGRYIKWGGEIRVRKLAAGRFR